MTTTYSLPEPEIEGWMGRTELEWLYNTASRMESIVEIGSWKGRSAHALLSGCRGYVFAVDHFQGSEEEIDTNHKEAKEKDIRQIFLQNVGHFRNLILMTMPSKVASRFIADRSIDMVFIDGSHKKEKFKEDLQCWLPKAKKMICGHDIGYRDVKEALEEQGLDYRVEATTIWVVDLRKEDANGTILAEVDQKDHLHAEHGTEEV